MKRPWWKDPAALIDMAIDITIVVTVVWMLYALGTIAVYFVGSNV